MKDLIKFLMFLIYTTLIFFVPNNIMILSVIVCINILAMLKTKLQLKYALINILKLMPFVIFTVIINCILDNYINAFFIGIKLVLVCNITYSYSKTTTVFRVSKVIKLFCKPLKFFSVNPEEIELLVCISLSMIPILKKEFTEVKDSCTAKGIRFSIKNMKFILSKLLISLIRRVNQIDEAIIEKGYNL